MDVGVAFPADAEPAEVVQPGEGALDDPAPAAQPRAVLGAVARDDRLDAPAPQRPAVAVVVVAAVGDDLVGTLARATVLASDPSDPIDELRQLGDVVAVASRERGKQRNAAAVDDQVVLRAGASAVERRGSGENAAAQCPDVAGVDDATRPVEAPNGVQPPQQLAVKPLPYSGRVPVA